MKLLISRVDRAPLIGYGLSLMLWLPGCNFRCPWCCFRDVVLGERVLEITADELKRFISEGGVKYIHVTGGEPTLHPNTLEEVFTLARDFDLACSLDTNLSRPSVLGRLLRRGLLDHVTCDVKAPLSDVAKYSEVTGLNIEVMRDLLRKIIESLRLLIGSSIDLEIRTVVVPTLISEVDILKLVQELLELGIDFTKVKYVLQQYVPVNTLSSHFRGIGKTEPKYLKHIAELIHEKYGIRVYIRLIDKLLEQARGVSHAESEIEYCIE
ncbi:MAG: hypothetical protein DRJ40_00975 [Thermoprotei archaeon]|nr:MAG: hypothetical protein DRJ40_00975 [Thermoprotei archaeon]